MFRLFLHVESLVLSAWNWLNLNILDECSNSSLCHEHRETSNEQIFLFPRRVFTCRESPPSRLTTSRGTPCTYIENREVEPVWLRAHTRRKKERKTSGNEQARRPESFPGKRKDRERGRERERDWKERDRGYRSREPGEMTVGSSSNRSTTTA